MSPIFINILYLVASCLIVVGLWKLLKPDPSGRGMMLMGGGLLLAVLVTLVADEVRTSIGTAIVALAVGGIGALAGLRVTKEDMPGRLAIIVACAGLATALVAIVGLQEAGRRLSEVDEKSKEEWKNVPDAIRRANAVNYVLRVPLRTSFPAILATLLGGVVAASAGISFLKITKSPLRKSLPKFDDASTVQLGAVLVCAMLGLLFAAWPMRVAFLWLELIAAVSLGYLLTIHLKIVDVPPVLAGTVAVLGLAIGAAGMVLGNMVMITGSALVTTGGAVLAQSLCRSLNVSMLGLLRGTESSKMASVDELETAAPAKMPGPATATADPNAPMI